METPLDIPTGTEPAPMPAPTPENTPKPGGGSWHWDATLPGWVENTYP
jgi:hypothetical protein